MKYESQADIKIFFVDYESQADLKVFFVDYDSKAGWKNREKMYLLRFKNLLFFIIRLLLVIKLN